VAHALARAGCRVRLMGATCLASELAGVPNIELLPACSEDPAMFLRSLDCFVYRTSMRWFEAYGRVVIEAMATGLPIVVGHHGGYADRLRDGVNAHVVHDTDEAIARVLALAAAPGQGARLGEAARRDAIALNAVELPRRTLAFLTDTPSAVGHESDVDAVAV